MKLYNRKGLMRGLGLTLLGVAFFLGDLFCFETVEPNIIWSVALIVVGLMDCGRCFSQQKAEEDMISEADERNRLVRLTSKARALDIVEIGCLVFAALFALLLRRMGGAAFSGALLTAGFTVLFIEALKLFTAFYYDRKK